MITLIVNSSYFFFRIFNYVFITIARVLKYVYLRCKHWLLLIVNKFMCFNSGVNDLFGSCRRSHSKQKNDCSDYFNGKSNASEKKNDKMCKKSKVMMVANINNTETLISAIDSFDKKEANSCLMYEDNNVVSENQFSDHDHLRLTESINSNIGNNTSLTVNANHMCGDKLNGSVSGQSVSDILTTDTIINKNEYDMLCESSYTDNCISEYAVNFDKSSYTEASCNFIRELSKVNSDTNSTLPQFAKHNESSTCMTDEKSSECNMSSKDNPDSFFDSNEKNGVSPASYNKEALFGQIVEPTTEEVDLNCNQSLSDLSFANGDLVDDIKRNTQERYSEYKEINDNNNLNSDELCSKYFESKEAFSLSSRDPSSLSDFSDKSDESHSVHSNQVAFTENKPSINQIFYEQSDEVRRHQDSDSESNTHCGSTAEQKSYESDHKEFSQYNESRTNSCTEHSVSDFEVIKKRLIERYYKRISHQSQFRLYNCKSTNFSEDSYSNKLSAQSNDWENVDNDDQNYDVKIEPLNSMTSLISIGAESLKNYGNDSFNNSLYEDALKSYSEAISVCEDPKLTSVIACNRAASFLAIKHSELSALDSSDAIALDNTNWKAYIRRFRAYEALEKWHDALEDINKALQLNESLKSNYAEVQKRIERLSKEQFEKEKEEIIKKAKNIGNWFLGKVGLSLDDFKLERNEETGAYNISYQKNVEAK